MSETLSLTSHAKINWVLHVGPIRADGYHDITTVFQELALGEKMVFRAITSPECRLSGFPDDIPAATNLVTRAWNLLRAEYPQVAGLEVHIDKSLPQGGGLGGGSSNAACTLTAINRLYHLHLRPEVLEHYAARLGSDVAFFIQGGMALATGRGEVLQQLPATPVYNLVLLFPEDRMSTAEGYRLLDEISRPRYSQHMLSGFLNAVRSGSHSVLAPHLHNDFELVAERFSWFCEARTKLEQAGATSVFLCGSGSTVAALCESDAVAQRIALQVGGIRTYT